jgi:uncharacterized membrane protein YeaQ/YmgE (transglycosylase-associated protein family)
MALGLVGAFLGTVLAEKLDLPLFWTPHIGGHPFPIIWAVIGSALFVALLGLISGPSRQRR